VATTTGSRRRRPTPRPSSPRPWPTSAAASAILDKEKDDEDAKNGPKDNRPLFKTVDERRESALKKFRDVETRFPGTGAAILARLSEARSSSMAVSPILPSWPSTT